MNCCQKPQLKSSRWKFYQYIVHCKGYVECRSHIGRHFVQRQLTKFASRPLLILDERTGRSVNAKSKGMTSGLVFVTISSRCERMSH